MIIGWFKLHAFGTATKGLLLISKYKIVMIHLIVLILLVFNGYPEMMKTAQKKEFIYVGTYNEKDKPGIFVFEFQRNTGKMELVQEVGGMNAPSYLEINPNGKHLYSVNRSPVIEGKKWGSVSSFRINPKNGTLIHDNDQSTFGSESCHISIDSKSRLVFVSNYSTGNITAFPVKTDGSLDTISDNKQHSGNSINPNRQKGPHVHQSTVSGDDRFLFVSDLGIDKVKVYSIDYTNNKLIPMPDSDGMGSGPRHSTVHDNQKFAYVINELSSTITVFSVGAEYGKLTPVQTISTIPDDFKEVNYCADIHIDPSGKYLYGSNRGHNSLAIFSIDQANGKLSEIGHQSTYGEWPRNFLVDPKGEFVFVANQNSDNITIFKINSESGELEKLDFDVTVPKPVCLKILEL
jgi:6-phosphogluconolactonase